MAIEMSQLQSALSCHLQRVMRVAEAACVWAPARRLMTAV